MHLNFFNINIIHFLKNIFLYFYFVINFFKKITIHFLKASYSKNREASIFLKYNNLLLSL